MLTIHARNVNDAYHLIKRIFHESPEQFSYSDTRTGGVHVLNYPAVTSYARPEERVLFDAKRNANPFFHLFESIWMLNGENQSGFLDQFIHDFGDRFAEPGTKTLHGAYGHRWRNAFDIDQLTSVVNRLSKYHNDRRSVIAMWDPITDLWDPMEMNEDTGQPFNEPRDLPCNTHLYPLVRQGDRGQPVLDLTVCCRSNDIVWGAYGANAVHFSFLLEYLAARIGVGIGRLYQFSNNFHVYENVLDKLSPAPNPNEEFDNPYDAYDIRSKPMFEVPHKIDEDIKCFMLDPFEHGYANPWFQHTAVPMLRVHMAYKNKNARDVRHWLSMIEDYQWWAGARLWLENRGVFSW